MADQQVAQGSSVGGNESQSIAQEVAAAVVASLSEFLKKQSVNDDRGFSTEVNGVYDLYENVRRSDAHRDRVQVLAEQALAHAIEVAHGVGLRSLDHFSALPPVAAKGQGC